MVNNNIRIDKDAWKENKPSNYSIKKLSYVKFDRSVNRINDKLDNIRGMNGFSYSSLDKKIEKANELLETICYYIGGTLDDINDFIDEPFFDQFDNNVGVLEQFEKINLDDYKTKNNLGIEEHKTSQYLDYPTGTYKTQSYSFKKDKIGFGDLFNNMEVKGYQGMPSFAEMKRKEYEDSVKNSNLDLSYDDYVEIIIHRGDIQHTVDRGWLNFLGDTLDTVGIVSAVSLFTGTNFITGEILTDKEKDGAVINTVLNVGVLAVTVFSAGTGTVAAQGLKAGISTTAKTVAKSLAVDMISGAAGLATINILDASGSPEMISMMAGLGVSFIGGYYGERAINRIPKVTGESAVLEDWSKYMSPEDAKRYNQYWDDVAKGLDTDTRVKLNQWQYRPDANLYNKYKDVYDNSKYFNQITGETIYPGMNGDVNIDGFVNGEYMVETLQPGKIIDRYGSESGNFLSPKGTSYAARALPPFMENATYTRYEVVTSFDVKSGVVAPWFNQPGGGTQFLTNYTVEELLDLEWIRVVK